MIFLQLLTCFLGIFHIGAVRLRDCSPHGGIEIEETATNVPITCDQFAASDTVGWGIYTSPDAADPTVLGNCYPDGQCDDSPNPITRPNGTTSVLTIVSPSRVWGSFDVHCEAGGSSARCQLNIVYPASMASSNCSVDVNTSQESWTVDGSCYISKAFSSRQYYHCQWTQTSDDGVTTTPSNQTDDQTSSPVRDYYSYSCRFSTPVPQLSGTYTYTVTAFPGDVTITAGSYHVQLPSSPVSGCSDQYYTPGDTLDCTCTLSNPGRPAATPVWSHDVSSGPRLQMVVTSQDHNRRLTCQARWGNRVVTHTDYVIRVASPPSPPTILPPSSDYPPIASVSRDITLTCASDTPGLPPATYTFSLTQGGQTSTDSQGRGTLTFDTVSKEHGGKVVSCRARNMYTDRAESVADGILTLNVYYHPEINITPVMDVDPNQCDLLTAESTRCHVIEGQRVHFRCTANGNPVPASFRWSPGNVNDLDLLIDVVDHSQHAGTYNCSVTSGPGTTGQDSRLPLRNWRSLTVTVLYPAAVTTFTLNSRAANLTVSVGEMVTLTCTAVGIPTPYTSLIRPGGDVIATVAQGEASVVKERVNVTAAVTVSCHDTGMYACDVNNAIGSSQQHRLAIYVQCGPDLAGPPGDPPVIYLNQEDRHVTFTVAAFPTPTISSLFRRLPDGSFSDQLVDIFITLCHRVSTLTLDVICNVTLEGMTSSAAAGMYRVVISNTIGSVELDLKVASHDEQQEQPGGKSSTLVIGATAGIMAAVILVVVAVVVLWLWRRQWVLPCNSVSSSTTSHKRESTPSASPDQPSSQPTIPAMELQGGANQEEPVAPGHYEELRLQEIGVRSIYSETCLPKRTEAPV